MTIQEILAALDKAERQCRVPGPQWDPVPVLDLTADELRALLDHVAALEAERTEDKTIIDNLLAELHEIQPEYIGTRPKERT